jgi:hypothetical protein
MSGSAPLAWCVRPGRHASCPVVRRGEHPNDSPCLRTMHRCLICLGLHDVSTPSPIRSCEDVVPPSSPPTHASLLPLTVRLLPPQLRPRVVTGKGEGTGLMLMNC